MTHTFPNDLTPLRSAKKTMIQVTARQRTSSGLRFPGSSMPPEIWSIRRLKYSLAADSDSLEAVMFLVSACNSWQSRGEKPVDVEDLF